MDAIQEPNETPSRDSDSKIPCRRRYSKQSSSSYKVFVMPPSVHTLLFLRTELDLESHVSMITSKTKSSSCKIDNLAQTRTFGSSASF
ncbi:hypothetical protein TNCV_3963251 [Trichonephila clavipes]|nr:hypothetical protein TNCV_3963251 [Trichonephila clavipes]